MTPDPDAPSIYAQVAGELLFTGGGPVPLDVAGADDDLVEWTGNGTQHDDPLDQPPQDPRWMPAPADGWQ